MRFCMEEAAAKAPPDRWPAPKCAGLLRWRQRHRSDANDSPSVFQGRQAAAQGGFGRGPCTALKGC